MADQAIETFYVPLEDLSTDPDNARLHPEENLKAIENSIRRFGQVLPLVVREGVIVGGNGTFEALKRTGGTHAKVAQFSGTEEEAKALAIALNRTSELATWDEEVLGRTLAELSEFGTMPDDLGFSDASLEELFPPSATDFQVAPADIEAPEPKESRGLGTPIIQYALIFDDEEQQKRFFAFLRRLKKEYPDEETTAARLDKAIATGEGFLET